MKKLLLFALLASVPLMARQYHDLSNVEFVSQDSLHGSLNNLGPLSLGNALGLWKMV